MLKFAIFVSAVLLTPAYAGLHKVPDEEPLITIDIPDEWQTKEVGESIQATVPGDSFHFMVVPPEGTKVAETMGEAMRYIRNSSGIMVKADSIKNETGKLNDMEVRHVFWEGKDKNGSVNIQFTIVFLTARKAVLLASWGPPEAEQKHKEALKKIFQSIKKA